MVFALFFVGPEAVEYIFIGEQLAVGHVGHVLFLERALPMLTASSTVLAICITLTSSWTMQFTHSLPRKHLEKRVPFHTRSRTSTLVSSCW